MRLVILFLLIIPCSLALDITEIMYDPGSELGGNYNEWVEVYSDEEIDLTNYKINDKDFDDVVINNEYLIIAENIDKFEEYFGNNNSVLDEDYKIVDATSFSLDDSGGIVNISDGVNEFVIEYTNEYGDGNGKSIEFFNGSFVESLNVKGTPGRGREESNEINVKVEIIEDIPEIISVEILPDELEDEGVQIFPEPKSDKKITIKVNATSSKGIDYISARLEDEEINFTDTGEFNFPYYKESGMHEINITVVDNSGLKNSKIEEFEFMKLIAFEFNPNVLDFKQVRKKSSSDEKYILLENIGNGVLDFGVYGTDLVNNEDVIDVGYLQKGYENNWGNLTKESEVLDVNLGILGLDEVGFRVYAPEVNVGVYNSKIGIMGLEG